MDYVFELAFKVRDYECDIQGIVNNAVYQNYLEHTRHEFLEFVGLNFARMHDDGIDAVVIRVEIDYKAPLKSGRPVCLQSKCGPRRQSEVCFPAGYLSFVRSETDGKRKSDCRLRK